MPRPLVTLTTDFGLNDHFVGTMKGVILNIVPDAQIVDISHAVQPFDVLDGALTLAEAYRYFPVATVHAVVVDPGVGSARRPIIASSGKYHFIAPDNGVLSLIFEREENVIVREITADHYFLQPLSNTFHGRDVFAPAAAYLARGVEPLKFGDPVTEFVRFTAPKPRVVASGTLRGIVLKVDRFGNLITNIRPEDAPQLFQADPPPFKIVIGNIEIRQICSNYAEGPPGKAFGILGSMGYLEIAANRSAAARILGVGKGVDVTLVHEGAAAAGSQ